MADHKYSIPLAKRVRLLLVPPILTAFFCLSNSVARWQNFQLKNFEEAEIQIKNLTKNIKNMSTKVAKKRKCTFWKDKCSIVL